MDYTNAPFYAISGSGYGKGFTVEEAVENHLAAVTRGVKVKDTIFNTRAELEAYFTVGGGAPLEWKAPEGTVGFVLDSLPNWEDAEGNYTRATEDHLVRNPHWKED